MSDFSITSNMQVWDVEVNPPFRFVNPRYPTDITEVVSLRVKFYAADNEGPASTDVTAMGYVLTKKGQRRKGARAESVFLWYDSEYHALEAKAVEYVREVSGTDLPPVR
jgi:hypothetical protein